MAEADAGRVLRDVNYARGAAPPMVATRELSLVASLTVEAAAGLSALAPCYAESILGRSLLAAWEIQGRPDGPVPLDIRDLS